MLNELKEELLRSLKEHFPGAKIESKESRGVIFELRAYVDEDIFIDAYANVLTGKRSFALITKNVRISGYDNYKFWHYHPPDNPNSHIPCDEPSIDSIILSFKDVLEKRFGKA